MDRLDRLLSEIISFRNERDWKQFHTQENLAKSIVIEAAELLENFQWGDSIKIDDVTDEIADVLIYVLLMAESLNIDIEDIILKKLEKNRKRFPIETVKGNSGKNTRFEIEE